MTEIQRKVVKQGKRNVVSRFILAKGDKDKYVAWKQDLVKLLHIFNVRSIRSSISSVGHPRLSNALSDTATNRFPCDGYGYPYDGCGYPSERFAGECSQSKPLSKCNFVFTNIMLTVTQAQARSVILNTLRPAVSSIHSTHPGESPPPPPRTFCGREEVIEKVVELTENLQHIALIGTAGIGKTSVALTVLHHDRIKERFGENRRFICCDQFPASPAHFLARLSQVVGAGVETPENLTPLRPFLSSEEILIILDNAESILDPHGTNAREIYTIVEELCQFDTICLCITSRITTIPPHCTRLEIPGLSMEDACDIFYHIYGDGGRSDITSDLIRRLNFNPLSITLLATIASRHAWDHDELAQEWDSHPVEVLQTGYESLGATIELSFVSPSFRNLGPNARDLLEVITCFPNGIDTADLDWLFPILPDRKNIFDTFSALSLTYENKGFINVPAPIRDYLSPRGPKSFPLLCATKDNHSSSASSSELQSWNVSSDLPSITPVCIGELTVTALIQHQAGHLTFDGEQLGPEEEWAPVSLTHEYDFSEMRDTIHIRASTSGGSRGVESYSDEPLGVVEQKIASKLGPMLRKGSIRLEAKLRKGLPNVSSSKLCPVSLINSHLCTVAYFTPVTLGLHSESKHPQRFSASLPTGHIS